MHLTRLLSILTLLIVSLTLPLFSELIDNDIRLGFSDLIPNEFQTILEQKHLASDIALNITQSGTIPMIEEFRSGNLDLCVLASPEGTLASLPEELEISKIPIAYQSAVVIVHPDNPINELTLDQLASIFGNDASTVKVRSWRDIGLASFTMSLINPYAVHQSESIASDLFRHLVLGSSSFKQSVSAERSHEIEKRVSQDKASIGVITSLPKMQNLKVLFLAKEDSAIGYGPNSDNIYFSDYPLRLPLYLVFKEANINRLYPLIKTILGEDISDFLQNNGFFPVPKMILDKYSAELEIISN